MNIGDDVRVDVAGTVTAVEPGRITLRATEGGAVWSVGTVVDVPAGAVVEQASSKAHIHAHPGHVVAQNDGESWQCMSCPALSPEWQP